MSLGLVEFSWRQEPRDLAPPHQRSLFQQILAESRALQGDMGRTETAFKAGRSCWLPQRLVLHSMLLWDVFRVFVFTFEVDFYFFISMIYFVIKFFFFFAIMEIADLLVQSSDVLSEMLIFN